MNSPNGCCIFPELCVDFKEISINKQYFTLYHVTLQHKVCKHLLQIFKSGIILV